MEKYESLSNSQDISDSNEDKNSFKETRNSRRNGANSKSLITKCDNFSDLNSEDDSLEYLKIADLSRASPKIAYGKKQKKKNHFNLSMNHFVSSY